MKRIEFEIKTNCCCWCDGIIGLMVDGMKNCHDPKIRKYSIQFNSIASWITLNVKWTEQNLNEKS